MQTQHQLYRIQIPQISIKSKSRVRCKIPIKTRQNLNASFSSYCQEQHYLQPKENSYETQFQRSNTNPEQVSFIKFNNQKHRTRSSQKKFYESHQFVKGNSKQIEPIQLISQPKNKQNKSSITKLERFIRSQMFNNKILQTLDNMKYRNKSISDVKTLNSKKSPQSHSTQRQFKLITFNSDSHVKGKPIFPKQYKDKLVYNSKNSEVLQDQSNRKNPKILINIIKSRQNQKLKTFTTDRKRQNQRKFIDPKPSYEVLVYRTSRNRIKFSSIESH